MSAKKSRPLVVTVAASGGEPSVTGRAGLLMYWRIAGWGVVPPAYLRQLRDMVRHLASGREVDLRAARYHADRLGLTVEVHP